MNGCLITLFWKASLLYSLLCMYLSFLHSTVQYAKSPSLCRISADVPTTCTVLCIPVYRCETKPKPEQIQCVFASMLHVSGRVQEE